MKTYTLKLVDGTDDQYKVRTSEGKYLCDDQHDEQFVQLFMVWELIERCEGDIDFLKHMLPKDQS